MLDIGWSEMAVIALVALIVIGPKELPQAMRAASKWVRKARSLAREFQSGVDDMIREADLEDARKAVQSAKSLDLDKALEETVDPTGEVGDEARDLDRTARSTDTDTADKGGAKKVGAGKGDAPAERATVVEHPLKVAPAHSIKPPAEDAEPEKAGAEGKTKTA
jgi:sec-independent protein translocase protein TatB